MEDSTKARLPLNSVGIVYLCPPHKLSLIFILTKGEKIGPKGGKFKGLSRFFIFGD
jgi:hypothetical protein